MARLISTRDLKCTCDITDDNPCGTLELVTKATSKIAPSTDEFKEIVSGVLDDGVASTVAETVDRAKAKYGVILRSGLVELMFHDILPSSNHETAAQKYKTPPPMKTGSKMCRSSRSQRRQRHDDYVSSPAFKSGEDSVRRSSERTKEAISALVCSTLRISFYSCSLRFSNNLLFVCVSLYAWYRNKILTFWKS